MRLAIVQRYLKDRVKKVVTKKYCIKPEKLFDRKRYYIIRRKTPWAGFYANYLHVAGHTVYALKKGYIPVVDMENYPTLYNEQGSFNGTNNAWEYYFNQPGGVSVSEAMNSGNYILGDYSTMRENIPCKDGKGYFYIEWNKAQPILNIIQKYMQPNEEILGQAKGIF